MLFVQYHQGQLSTSCVKRVLERPVIHQWAYCKLTRYKYSITARESGGVDWVEEFYLLNSWTAYLQAPTLPYYWTWTVQDIDKPLSGLCRLHEEQAYVPRNDVQTAVLPAPHRRPTRCQMWVRSDADRRRHLAETERGSRRRVRRGDSWRERWSTSSDRQGSASSRRRPGCPSVRRRAARRRSRATPWTRCLERWPTDAVRTGNRSQLRPRLQRETCTSDTALTESHLTMKLKKLSWIEDRGQADRVTALPRPRALDSAVPHAITLRKSLHLTYDLDFQ